MDGLRCIDSYTRVCLDRLLIVPPAQLALIFSSKFREQRIYFNSLYTGTTQVIEDLCR